ncbi:monoglyceride lipase-like isoform X2 [Scyliorhinus torazame]|uniref:monoglyceride lipase-like isoform X2 n=1 Tax=Scyliorhinus torazame TaxID=75743 RepID=UPI003B5B443E
MGCRCAKRPELLESRKTPQGLPYSDLPHFINADGKYLFCRYWPPPNKTSRALLMLIHNAGEHSGRYMEIVSLFNKHSLFVFSHDHIGHGQSEGERLCIADFRIYVRDCVQHLDMLKRKFPLLKIYLFAVSMIMFSKAVNHLLPNVPLGYINPRLTSRDEMQVNDYIRDPLNCHVPVRVRFAFEVLHALNNIERIFPNITVPMLILHGELDKFSDIRGSYIMFGKVASTDKTFKVFSNCYHELQNELPEVIAELLYLVDEWLEQRLPLLEATERI